VATPYFADFVDVARLREEQVLFSCPDHWVAVELLGRFYRVTTKGLVFAFRLGARKLIGMDPRGMWLLDPVTHHALLVDPADGKQVPSTPVLELAPDAVGESPWIWDGWLEPNHGELTEQVVRTRVSDQTRQVFPIPSYGASALGDGMLGIVTRPDGQSELVHYGPDGLLRWSFGAADLQFSEFSTRVSDGVLLSLAHVKASRDEWLIALDAATGVERWRRPIPRSYSHDTRALLRGTYWAGTEGSLLGIDAATGETVFLRDFPGVHRISVGRVAERVVMLLELGLHRAARIELWQGQELDQTIQLTRRCNFRSYSICNDTEGNLYALASNESMLRLGREPLDAAASPFPRYAFERIAENKLSAYVARTDTRDADALIRSVPAVVHQLVEATTMIPGSSQSDDPECGGELRIEAPHALLSSDEALDLERVIEATMEDLVELWSRRAPRGAYSVEVSYDDGHLDAMPERVAWLGLKEWLALAKTWRTEFGAALPQERWTESGVALLLSAAHRTVMSYADVLSWSQQVNRARTRRRKSPLGSWDDIAEDELWEALDDEAITYRPDPGEVERETRRLSLAFRALAYERALPTKQLARALSAHAAEWPELPQELLKLAKRIESIDAVDPSTHAEVLAHLAPWLHEAKGAWITLAGILDGTLEVLTRREEHAAFTRGAPSRQKADAEKKHPKPRTKQAPRKKAANSKAGGAKASQKTGPKKHR
jgi:hypothetical protein